MKPLREVGIVGYGGYIPRYRIKAAEVARVWCGGEESLPIEEKAVAGPDEDTTTVAIEAARNALARARIAPKLIGAVWVGSESKPYAVKPSSTTVAEALGAGPHVLAGDWEFACKAGTEALQAAFALVGSGMAQYALAIGADTAQGRPGDELEYTAAAGGAAFLVGAGEESLAILEGSTSYATDTPDFFRRPEDAFPRQGHRFTGAPAYFAHSLGAARTLREERGYTPQDFIYAVFHQPNLKFPSRLGNILGFSQEQMAPGLLVGQIGNTYAGSSPLGLAAVLDIARPGERILLVSFGSGAGSDAFSFQVSERITERQALAPTVQDYIALRREIDYATYVRFRGKLRMK